MLIRLILVKVSAQQMNGIHDAIATPNRQQLRRHSEGVLVLSFTKQDALHMEPLPASHHSNIQLVRHAGDCIRS